jgi:hypothetical protein
MTATVLSATRVNKFSNCGYAYFQKYIKGVPEQLPPLRIFIGSFVGDALQALIIAYKDQGLKNPDACSELVIGILKTLMTTYQFPEAVATPTIEFVKHMDMATPSDKYSLDDLWVEHAEQNLLPVRYKPKKGTEGTPAFRAKGTYVKEASRIANVLVKAMDSILSTYANLVGAGWLEGINTSQGEVEFNIDVQGVLFNGKFDLVVQRTDGSFLIIEFKHSSADYTPDNARRLNQVVLYAIAATRMYGKGNFKILLVNAKEEENKVSYCDVSKEDAKSFVERSKLLIKAEQAEVYFPACGASVKGMHSTVCGFAHVCPHYVKTTGE